MSNQMRSDPTRTSTLRKQMVADMTRRFKAVSKAIYELIVLDDSFGLDESEIIAFNQQVERQVWRFQSNPQKVRSYRKWLQQQIDAEILTTVGGIDGRPWTAPYIESAYRKGGIRAYIDLRAGDFIDEDEGFILGSKEEFIRIAFSQPTAQAQIELLYTRAFDELQGVTQTMSQQMSRILADGLVQGHGAAKIARSLRDNVTKLTNTRAKVIARTEIVRSHAEGQLDSFEFLGVEEVGIMAEWSTAEDDRVCPMCAPLEGVVMTIEEARGLLPRHPNCRCAWIPADVKRREPGQLWGADKTSAIEESIQAEAPTGKRVKRSSDQVKTRSVWAGKELV